MPYIYPSAALLHNQPKVGNEQCVTLVRNYTIAPPALNWREGESVLGNKNITPGTAIATFKNGRYANRSTGNHAAFYLDQNSEGIWVVDQWHGPSKPHISRRFIRIKKAYASGSFEDPSNNARAYAVIE